MFKKRRCKDVHMVDEKNEIPQYIVEPNNLDLMNKMHRLEALYIQMMTNISQLHQELENINKQIDNISIQQFTESGNKIENNVQMNDYLEDEDELNSYFS
jgi:cell fate (sporulation/competence/biofilm development) regulator YlbF (YheA/YmcA/DUF963 family)